MSIQYLIDENLPPLYREQLLYIQPDLIVWIALAGNAQDYADRITYIPL
jgi:hypothetical protein